MPRDVQPQRLPQRLERVHDGDVPASGDPADVARCVECSATRMKRVTVCRGVSRPPAPVRRSRSRWRPRTSRRCTDVFLTVCRVTLRSSNYEHPCTPHYRRRARALTQLSRDSRSRYPHAPRARPSPLGGAGAWRLEAGPRYRPRACPPLVIRHPPWPRRHAACLYAAAPRERSAVYHPRRRAPRCLAPP